MGDDKMPDDAEKSDKNEEIKESQNSIDKLPLIPVLNSHKSMSEVLKELKEENQGEEEEHSEDLVIGEELHILEHTTSSGNFVDNSVNAHYTITEQDKSNAEDRRKERLEFQNVRISTMDEDEYLAFH